MEEVGLHQLRLGTSEGTAIASSAEEAAAAAVVCAGHRGEAEGRSLTEATEEAQGSLVAVALRLGTQEGEGEQTLVGEEGIPAGAEGMC